MSQLPYCFVFMPFGTKRDPSGGADIDFDAIYESALEPAVTDAGLVPFRDDRDRTGGIVQQRLFEALLLCDYAVADLSTGNPNVFYELGIRHAIRPRSTLSITSRVDAVPFDLRFLRLVRYALDDGNRLTEVGAERLRRDVGEELQKLRHEGAGERPRPDSPLFQLLEGFEPAPLTSLKTDLFVQWVEFARARKGELETIRRAAMRGPTARNLARDEAHALQASLGELRDVEAGVLVELLLTYRALEDWDAMVTLVGAMPGYLRGRVLVQEQLAFALNRRAADGQEEDRDRAVAILREVERRQGPTPETCGLLGRVHKDRWAATRDTDPRVASVHLEAAIRAYRRGFEADPRDYFPGINAATLSALRGTADGRRECARLLPVVEFAAERQLRLDEESYWARATLLEAAALREDREAARRWLSEAKAHMREPWQGSTTARNLAIVATGTESRAVAEWLCAFADELKAR